MTRRGEQAVIEEAQRRRPILSVSPQQRRMSIDELPLLDLFRRQCVHPAGLSFAFDCDEVDLDQFRIAEPGSRLLVAACFTCFIRLRSGIANSHQNKPSKITFPDRSRRHHEITMRLWQPHGGSAFTGRWQRRSPKPDAAGGLGVSLSVGNGWKRDIPDLPGL
jgi:hypothetical protein